MNILNVKGVEIGGIVACLPENKLINREDCLELYGDGIETLIKATGIESKCVANQGTTALDLGVAAAEKLLKNTGTKPEEIGAVICVTFTPEYLMPADAPAAQNRLGIPNDCLAFDINMACSGYGYGMYMAASLAGQLGKKVLLLDGDIQTAYVSRQDKSTMPVMADAGTATLLVPSDHGKDWHFSFYTDGGRRENALYIPAGGSRNPATHERIERIEREDGSYRAETDIFMNGFEIFRFVAMDASKFLIEFMKNRDISDENLDIWVPHQANIYMISQLTKKLKISKEKMWKSGGVYGNPGSASVPLTIAENAKHGFENGHTMFSGFGGGLSISVAEIELNKDGYYNVIEYGKD